MDSGHSGSIQSSSGADEEFDSVKYFSNQPPPTPSMFFNPPSNNYHLDAFSHSAKNLNEVVYSTGGLLSDLSAQGQPSFPSSSTMLQSVHENDGGRTSCSPAKDEPHVARNPKKRTRASRRAPTTVLTTDASNFRSMVQEFTGIPASPFPTTVASPYARRLDLFKTGSSTRPFYNPLLPSTQKFHPNPFLPSSSSSSSFLNSTVVDAIASTTCITDRTATNNTITTSIPKTAAANTTVNMQNPILTFQSLIQSSLPPDTLKFSSFGTKNSASNSFGEFGTSQGSWRDDRAWDDESQDIT